MPKLQLQAVDQVEFVPDNSDTATVTVMVRDTLGQPVPGLSAGDFVLTENDERVPVLAATNGSRANSTSGSQSSSTRERLVANTESPHDAVNVLLILSPMSANSRHDAIKSALKLFADTRIECCQAALLDDSGTFTQGTTAVKSRLEILRKKLSPPQYFGGEWMTSARRAIEDLGIMPGRHAIIFASDDESKLPRAIHQNPNLIRVDPSMFIAYALRAHAAMYTIQSSGPGVVVPFGDAESQGVTSKSGSDLLSNISQDTAAFGSLRSQLLYAASVTGGLPSKDIPHALNQIVQDAEGCYTLHFLPPAPESDALWHLVKIKMTAPGLHISEVSLYKVPSASRRIMSIPSAVAAAFQPGARAKELKVDTFCVRWSWVSSVFPDSVAKRRPVAGE